ncbi:recombinase family protein [Arenibacter sp. M-2]|uniref:recombinase family protein n=1 Tax=Arenibacter sp. M-2 TaxID=3053612 RepID=UPI00257025DC|nr:recombinase family protein [Arenibacter sp. M-2]MDL5513969.1 recombinase family protein [Arenibacter sp. M-2]
MLAIYARKSVEREGSKSTKEQSLRGQELAKALKMPFEIYTDEGISGTGDINKRPEFSRMLDDIEDGKITVVYAYHQDRIERNPQTRYFFNDLLRKNDVKLYTDHGEIDLNNDEQEMLGDMISVMSKYYVRTTKRRIKNSVKRNIAEGKIHGILAYGYMAAQNKMMMINPEEAKVVELIFKLSMEGKGYIAIAKELDSRGIPTRYGTLKNGGIKSKSTYKVKNIHTGNVEVKEKGSAPWVQATIRGILYNRLYKGERSHLDTIHQVPNLVIIQPGVWDKVNRQLKANEKPRGKDSDHKYLLNGVLICGKCGKRLTGRYMNRGYHNYRCVDKRQKQGNRCFNRDVLGKPLEKIIWNRLFIEGRLLDSVKEYLNENKSSEKKDILNEKLKHFTEELRKLEGNKNNVLDLIFKGVLKESQIKSRINQADVDIEDCKVQISRIKDSLRYENEKIIREGEAEKDLIALKENIPFDTKQEIIRKYVKDINVRYMNKSYRVLVIYHLNLLPELYTIDTKYNLAIEGFSEIVMPLSEKYKKLHELDPELTGDSIKKRLLIEQLKNRIELNSGVADQTWGDLRESFL